MPNNQEERDWKINKFISKYKVSHPDRESPSREDVEQYIDELEQQDKHIVYPLAGLEWDEAEWQAQYEFGKTLKIIDVDFAEYSSCSAKKCYQKLKCKRGLLYLYMIENDVRGHTVLALNGISNCEHFVPYNSDDEK